MLRGPQGKGKFGWACPANLDTVTVISLFDILGLVYSFSMKQSWIQISHVSKKHGLQGSEGPVKGIKTHPFIEDRAKASFLPASRMKRELVHPEQKNLGRIILDKAPGMK